MKDSTNNLPQHIAIIMDGNGRWARQHGKERTFGHQAGVEAVRSVIEGAAEMGIKHLTLYTFSTENWNRPKDEVDMLMNLLVQCVHNELPALMKNKVRLLVSGRTADLPEDCRASLQSALDQTAGNVGLTVTLALSYGGRAELTDAVKAIAAEAAEGSLNPDNISQDTIKAHLYLPEVPDPDLLVRTGGDCRISNFLLWQIAYAELFFVPVMWPDFRKENLREIVHQFMSRERRFGKTGEQVREQ